MNLLNTINILLALIGKANKIDLKKKKTRKNTTSDKNNNNKQKQQ
jgi:hypothetical protein